MHDAFGGDLLRSMVQGISHYWNRFPDGREVDLTRQQFGPDAVIGAGEVRGRDYVLSFPETEARYARLNARLRAASRRTR